MNTSGKYIEDVTAYPQAELHVDAMGLQCPLPVLKLQKALRGLKPGDLASLAATDPASRIDVPHFCNQSGHTLIASSEADGVFNYLVECGS